MKFAYNHVLLALPLLCLGGYGLHRLSTKIRGKRMRLFSPASRFPVILRTLNNQARSRKTRLFFAGLCLLVIALARPLWGPKDKSADQVGAEFYFVLDISRSMQVRDVKPDRLQAVKDSLAKWLKTRAGDRIGLILVAGDAFVQAPLTSDYTALGQVLMQSDPNAISQGGTKLPSAIVTAVKALKESEQRQKVVVIISDGENLEDDPIAYTRQARVEMNQAITFYTVGVGTPEGGKVPHYKKGEKIDYKKEPKNFVRDEYGVQVNSRLDERTLRGIAQAGGGRYYLFDPEGDTWNALYEKAIKPLATKVDKLYLKDYTELFQIPLFFAVLLLAYELAINTRLKNPKKAESIISLPKPGAAPAAASMDTKPLPKPKPLAIGAHR